jgi:aminoglycoside phosphotransferase (APT) family kinase protein
MSETAPADAQLLPPALVAQVQAATGAALEQVRPRGGGGASREGAEITLRYPDGRTRRAYLTYDLLKGGAGDDESFLREAAALRALSGPLSGSGVKAAPFIAAIPESRALVTGFTEGDADFKKVKSPVERSKIAAGFMAQLAALHRIDVTRTPVAGFGPIRPPSEQVAGYIGVMRARSLAAGPDPLILLSLDWLERNVPKDPEHAVIVHADAGPGNFLYRGDEVTALLDWELVHYGDPMEDLAMLCLRNLIQPFVPLPEAFAAYEAAGGARVDLDRLRYYRLFYQTKWGGRAGRFTDPGTPPPPVIGMSLMFSTMHRLVLTEALSEIMGVELIKVATPEAPPAQYERTFEVALSDLRDFIVPRLDQQASAKAKGLARLVKWWRDSARYGPALQAAELDELARTFGRRFGSVQEGRQALCEAILSHAIDPAGAMRHCQRITGSERIVLSDSMGALADTHFAPLA